VRGVLEEVLFDVVQAFETPIYQSLNHPKSLLSLSKLTGIGDGMALEVQEEVTPDRYYRLPYSLFPDIKALQKKIDQQWEKWVKIGLACVSPNQAPLLLEAEELRNRISPKVYRNMVKGLQGQTSLRDLAFKFKKQGNFFTLATAIAPFYEEQLITFNQVKDLSVNSVAAETKPSYSTFLTASEEPSKDPLFLAIDSSRKNQSLLSAIAERQGYAFEAISNGINALQKITQTPLGLPKIIFASYEMAVIKPTEFCTILRRLDLPQPVPIIIYSKQSLPNREAREILEAGASEVINRNSLTPSYVNSILKKYQKLSQRQQKQTIDQQTYSQSKLTFKQRDLSMTMS
jgi:CheY-like chemotaxis protein